MDIYKSGKFLNRAITIMTIFLVVIPVCFIIGNYNFDKLSPTTFVSVKIEGNPELKLIQTQDSPILNDDAIKNWLMEGANEMFNWDSTNYKRVIKDSAYFFDPDFYKIYAELNTARVETLIASGVQISSSIIGNKPVLISKAKINGVVYRRYYMVTSTVYKSEFKTTWVQHEIIATVKPEDPKKYNRGIVLVDVNIR